MNRVGTEDLPLFAWPETRPAPAAEQSALPMPEVSIEARYRIWRDTDDGRRTWAAVLEEASTLVASGATRLSSKALVETVRSRLRLPVNNSWTAWIARDLHSVPAFRDLIELRERTSL